MSLIETLAKFWPATSCLSFDINFVRSERRRAWYCARKAKKRPGSCGCDVKSDSRNEPSMQSSVASEPSHTIDAVATPDLSRDVSPNMSPAPRWPTTTAVG